MAEFGELQTRQTVSVAVTLEAEIFEVDDTGLWDWRVRIPGVLGNDAWAGVQAVKRFDTPKEAIENLRKVFTAAEVKQ